MITLALLLAAPIQTTWHVDQSAAGPGTGTQADPYTRVDYAVSRPTTLTGDTVLVGPGTYPAEVIDFAGKDLILRSSGGPSVTTLEAVAAPDPSQSILRLENGETLAATIEGFTLVAGNGHRQTGSTGYGGGIYCDGASVTLRDLEISSVTGTATGAGFGGGIYVRNGSLDVLDCTLRALGQWNYTLAGGGLYATNAVVNISGSTITNCTANRGLGVFAELSTLTVTDSSFDANYASLGVGGGMALFNCQLDLSESRVRNNAPGLEGAGIFAANGSQLMIEGSTFSGNRYSADPYPGGAIYLRDAACLATIRDSWFTGNRGQWGGAIFGTVDIDGCYFGSNRAHGGGQYSCRGGAISGSGTVRRSVFFRNNSTDAYSSGGGALDGSFTVDQCTFVDNEGTGDPFGSPVYSVIKGTTSLTNSILRGGSDPRVDPNAAMTYSNVEGGALGLGNFDLPESLWPDLALLPDSPSIDSGDPASPLDSDGTRADVGAWEYNPFRCEDGCEGRVGLTICTATANSTGQPAELAALGSSAASTNLVVLNVTSTPPGSLGFFLGSRMQGNQPLGGGSQGVLCLGGSILRFSNMVLNDRGTDVVSFRLPLTAFPQGNIVQAGDTWSMQYWFRDANPQATSNTSSALELTFQ